MMACFDFSLRKFERLIFKLSGGGLKKAEMH